MNEALSIGEQIRSAARRFKSESTSTSEAIANLLCEVSLIADKNIDLMERLTKLEQRIRELEGRNCH
jgi:hypothetical protein